MGPDNLARYPSLVDKTVLITGGGSCIGAAMSLLFAEQDCRVVALDTADGPSRRLVEALRAERKRAFFVHCDVTDVEALQRTIRAVEAERPGMVGYSTAKAAINGLTRT